jgi:hypothetical protein
VKVQAASSWKEVPLTFFPISSDSKAKLVITAEKGSSVSIGYASLMPVNTWKNRTNGLRPDLAERIAQLEPGFLRFPGGCYVEGNNLGNAFEWRGTLAPIEKRPGTPWSFWGYTSSNGLGYHEYLQLCEDVQAEPMFVINCGMSHSEITPMDKMDRHVKDALDAIEYAQSVNGKGPQMHNVGHCTFVAPEDMRRAAQLGATLEVSPYLWSPAPICSDIAAAVGETVIERVWPIREMLDAGVLVVAGSDWSVVPSVNPWIGIETMITREKPGGSAETFGASQAVTIEEAIEIFTINAARQEGMADRVGRIAVGMVADIIVVDRNPFEVSKYEIHQVVVEQTIINGEVVFNRSNQAPNSSTTTS